MTMETAQVGETAPTRETRQKNGQVCSSNCTIPHDEIVVKYEKEGNKVTGWIRTSHKNNSYNNAYNHHKAQS
jgi:hypothetical protein